MLKNEVIPKSEEVTVDGEISRRIHPFVFACFNERNPKGGKDDRKKLFGYKLSSARIVIENVFGRLKGRFCC